MSECKLLRLLAVAACSWLACLGGAAECAAQSECLVQVKRASTDAADGSTLCAEAHEKTCVFQLQVCLNQGDAGCPAGAMKKKVKAKGKCGAVGRLQVKPDGTNAVCGSLASIKVRTTKRGRREGRCDVRIAAKATAGDKRRDVDKLRLVCKPNPGDCGPTGTTTTTTPAGPSTTTTTLPPCLSDCPCCVLPVAELAGCVAR